MKYIKIIATIILILGINTKANCQEKKKVKGWEKFWKNVSIRKSFESKTKDDDKAAQALFTFPDEKDNFFVVNAGVGYDFAHICSKNNSFKNIFSGFVLYNRNNEIDKEQENLKIGITNNQHFLSKNEQFSFFVNNTIEYYRDYVDNSNSFVGTSYWHPFSKKGINLSGYSLSKGRLMYFFTPQIGVEYQNVLEAKAITDEGYDVRGYFGIAGNLAWKKKTRSDSGEVLEKKFWTKGVELTVSYDGRYSFTKNIENGLGNYNPMFKSEIVIYPTKDNLFSIGFSYNEGTNPIDGIEKQKFWLLTLKIKK